MIVNNGISYRAFIQARMNSERLPGKVLMPLHGEPIISHVLRKLKTVCPAEQTVVLTSVEPSDDPLALYVESLGITVFRGSLNNVFERFLACTDTYPCQWFLRLSADSPYLDPQILEQVLVHAGDLNLDLVTTTFPRTFPKGQNAELINTRTFASVDASSLSHHEREHITAHFYHNSSRFRIKNIESDDPSLAETSLAVDSLEDFRRLEKMQQFDPQFIGKC